MDKKTIEQKVAETILQKTEKFTIGGQKYTVAPPSTATLILVSEELSLLPRVALDQQKVAEESLSIARQCRPLGNVAAILILGAKNLTETVKTKQTRQVRKLWGLIKRNVTVEVETVVDRKAELAEKILQEYSPKALNLLVGNLLNKLELGDFFALTTFLIEINMLRPTKVVEATASGQ